MVIGSKYESEPLVRGKTGGSRRQALQQVYERERPARSRKGRVKKKPVSQRVACAHSDKEANLQRLQSGPSTDCGALPPESRVNLQSASSGQLLAGAAAASEFPSPVNCPHCCQQQLQIRELEQNIRRLEQRLQWHENLRDWVSCEGRQVAVYLASKGRVPSWVQIWAKDNDGD